MASHLQLIRLTSQEVGCTAESVSALADCFHHAWTTAAMDAAGKWCGTARWQCDDSTAQLGWMEWDWCEIQPTIGGLGNPLVGLANPLQYRSNLKMLDARGNWLKGNASTLKMASIVFILSHRPKSWQDYALMAMRERGWRPSPPSSPREPQE